MYAILSAGGPTWSGTHVALHRDATAAKEQRPPCGLLYCRAAVLRILHWITVAGPATDGSEERTGFRDGAVALTHQRVTSGSAATGRVGAAAIGCARWCDWRARTTVTHCGRRSPPLADIAPRLLCLPVALPTALRGGGGWCKESRG
jgi:hypothetical protein